MNKFASLFIPPPTLYEMLVLNKTKIRQTKETFFYFTGCANLYFWLAIWLGSFITRFFFHILFTILYFINISIKELICNEFNQILILWKIVNKYSVLFSKLSNFYMFCLLIWYLCFFAHTYFLMIFLVIQPFNVFDRLFFLVCMGNLFLTFYIIKFINSICEKCIPCQLQKWKILPFENQRNYPNNYHSWSAN